MPLYILLLQLFILIQSLYSQQQISSIETTNVYFPNVTKILFKRSGNLKFAPRDDAYTMICLVNTLRYQNGLKPYLLDRRLVAAATAKVNDMITNNYFAHVSPTGVAWTTFIDQAGYYWLGAGENLALGFADDLGAFNGFLNSPGHKINMLSPGWTSFGSYHGISPTGTSYIAQEFASGADTPTDSIPVDCGLLSLTTSSTPLTISTTISTIISTPSTSSTIISTPSTSSSDISTTSSSDISTHSTSSSDISTPSTPSTDISTPSTKSIIIITNFITITKTKTKTIFNTITETKTKTITIITYTTKTKSGS